ncbi:MAG: YicC family protein [Calditrichaeota bacterium]|nr:MAG: YicC family protein [Calditrichota bacterium]MBL1204143.1 YicC family protein [Calditrichota bacterium]NOG43974.1 YicC family protein [Calditrichota bacterium]
MHSMTGYGKGQLMANRFEITVEIKSVNNRYLDIMFRMPSMLSSFESGLRKIVKNKVSRGKVSVFIEIKEVVKSDNGNTVNDEKLLHYYNTLKAIKTKLNLSEEIDLRHLLTFQELFEPDISSVDEKEFSEQLSNTLEKALQAFNNMRLKEGEHLIKDMNERLTKINSITKTVLNKAPANVRSEFDKLLTRINELLENQQIDPERLEQEIALISDKVDITEELTRMESHISQFRQTLKRDKELGKKLTFILQEMHREANTMNSKTTDVEISHLIIQVKEEIEKIREQTQNIE